LKLSGKTAQLLASEHLTHTFHPLTCRKYQDFRVGITVAAERLFQRFKGEISKMIKAFIQDETGAELAEYAVGVALLVAIGIVVYKVLGNAINTSNSQTGSNIQNAKYP